MRPDVLFVVYPYKSPYENILKNRKLNIAARIVKPDIALASDSPLKFEIYLEFGA
jgi:hypothetical protein